MKFEILRCRKVWEGITVDAPDREAAFDKLDLDSVWYEIDDETIDLRIELLES